MIVNYVLKTATLSPGISDFTKSPRSGIQQSHIKKAIAEKNSSKMIVIIAFLVGVG